MPGRVERYVIRIRTNDCCWYVRRRYARDCLENIGNGLVVSAMIIVNLSGLKKNAPLPVHERGYTCMQLNEA